MKYFVLIVFNGYIACNITLRHKSMIDFVIETFFNEIRL
jgi:hypothetical protein